MWWVPSVLREGRDWEGWAALLLEAGWQRGSRVQLGLRTGLALMHGGAIHDEDPTTAQKIMVLAHLPEVSCPARGCLRCPPPKSPPLLPLPTAHLQGLSPSLNASVAGGSLPPGTAHALGSGEGWVGLSAAVG